MFVIAAAILLAAALFAGDGAARQKPAQEKATAPQPAEYAGSEACQACHEDIFKAFQANPHHQVEKAKRWEGKACESCHGPGAKHAESVAAADIINPAKLQAARADQLCLKCHLQRPTMVGRIQGSHAAGEVACTECHAVHKGFEQLHPRRKAQVNSLCSSCHPSVWAEFQRPHKHPLAAAAMSCVDCHNPHGTLFRRDARTVSANEPGCFRCHSDKRGPFVFEHASVRLEGCRACHEPHGSANPRMLTRAEVRFLCLECHSNITAANTLGGIPPAFHDLRSTRYQNCTICHTKIHGSYVDRGLER